MEVGEQLVACVEVVIWVSVDLDTRKVGFPCERLHLSIDINFCVESCYRPNPDWEERD